MMSFINMFYRETPYAENTRETVRKNALHHFRMAAFVEDNGLATNSPNYRYRLTEEFLEVLKASGSDESVKKFLKKHTKAFTNRYPDAEIETVTPENFGEWVG